MKIPFVKSYKVEVLSEIRNLDERKEIVRKIAEFQKTQGRNLTEAFVDSCFDWIFVRENETIVITLAIIPLAKFADLKVFELSKFASHRIKNSKISLEDYRAAISDVFAKATLIAKKSQAVDWLVQSVDHFDIRASTRAGFGVEIFEEQELSKVIEYLRNKVVAKNKNIKEKLYGSDDFKGYCSRKLQFAASNLSATYRKGREGKSVRRELRILRKNREFIEQNSPKKAYYGLIFGIKTK